MTNLTTKNGMTGAFNINYTAGLFDKDIALLERIEKEVTAVNRERKIESILEDKEFIEYKQEETQTYKDWLRAHEYAEYINKQIEESINYSEYIVNHLYMKY